MYTVLYGGGGGRDFGKYYVSPAFTQQGRGGYQPYYGRGRGVGEIFRGIYNFLVPLVKSGGKVLGKELVRGGIDVLGGLAEGKKSLSELVKDAGKGTVRNLASMAENKIDAMGGSGLRIKGIANVRQSFIRGTTVKPGTRKSAGRVVKKRTKRRTGKKKKKAVKGRKSAKKRVKRGKKRAAPKKKRSRKRKSSVAVGDIFN